MHPEAGRHDAQVEPFQGGFLAQGPGHFLHQRVQGKIAERRGDAARIETRNIQKRPQQAVGILDRLVNPFDQVTPGLLLGVLQFAGQGRGQETGSRERLQKIVTGRRQEAGLGLGRGLGQGIGLFQILHQGLALGALHFQLRRAQADLFLQRVIGFQQAFLGHPAGGDVLVDTEKADHSPVLIAGLVENLPGPGLAARLFPLDIEDLPLAGQGGGDMGPSLGILVR